MMKFSNNYIAEILTKNLGAEQKGLPGTMEKGVQVIRDYMKEKGMKDSELYNPSGLSRKNKFTPRDVLKVLASVKNSFRVYPEFLSSLPISGVDGTLKRHLGTSDQYDGHVRAKTGHLSGVSSLSGFISGEEGQIYSFVFLFNGAPGDDQYQAKELFDKIILRVLKNHNSKG
jgi:D-alanyl-D-alanine carboxypeptidase/D-alanyl-D-alanine-endopeptidase (penicillin-binding protein 4)